MHSDIHNNIYTHARTHARKHADKLSLNHSLMVENTLSRKRTSVGETIQQDLDTRFCRHEADKFATAPRLCGEGKTASDRRSVAQTDRRAGKRTLVETPMDVSCTCFLIVSISIHSFYIHVYAQTLPKHNSYCLLETI